MSSSSISLHFILQDEIIRLHLIQFLSAYDLSNLILVNQKFKEIVDINDIWKFVYLQTFGEKTSHLPNEGKEIMNLRRRNQWKQAYHQVVELMKNPKAESSDPFIEYEMEMKKLIFLDIFNKPLARLSFDGSVPQGYKRRANSLTTTIHLGRDRTETI